MDTAKVINIIEDLIEDLVLIPGGNFLMGPTPENKTRENELPQHLVKIQSFLMGKYLITQEQWEATTKLSKVNIELNSHPSCLKGDNLPVESITWEEALEFCNRLSIFTGLNITLPSESQWEYACRAGTTTRYYCGDNPNLDLKLANYDSFRINPTDSYSPNPWGLYDMYGKVGEWCLDDWHPNYEGAPIDDRPWLDYSTMKKVVRGGSWDCYIPKCSSASRKYQFFNYPSSTLGFRIHCSLA